MLGHLSIPEELRTQYRASFFDPQGRLLGTYLGDSVRECRNYRLGVPYARRIIQSKTVEEPTWTLVGEDRGLPE